MPLFWKAPSARSILFGLALCLSASPAAACSLLVNVSEWVAGAAYLGAVVLGLVALAIFRRRARPWAVGLLILVALVDVSLEWLTAPLDPASMTAVIIDAEGKSHEILADSCGGNLGHASRPGELWRALKP